MFLFRWIRRTITVIVILALIGPAYGISQVWRAANNPVVRQAIHLTRDQFERTLKSVKVEYVENHFPKGLQPVFLQQDVAVKLSELLAHDHA